MILGVCDAALIKDGRGEVDIYWERMEYNRTVLPRI